ncbi:helix-turn-helix domain-containing protein [Micropruina sp.]|uniref:helix-turn-helix domain-containing protein n=1 Tax=Micropruina sp. TaxID=2737536 RepID=UPI0039E5BE8C
MSKQMGIRELGEFLRSRRALLTPADVGLPTGGNRRVPGLRREELAIIAGISPDHYQRIEQGRSAPSVAAIRAIADALRLTADEEHYLRRLASTDSTVGTSGVEHRVGIPDHILKLVEYSESPIYLLNHRRDILAWNPAARTLLCDFDDIEPENRNIAWLIFTDSHFRSLYREWDETARTIVGVLRYAEGDHPEDQELKHLIARLTTASSVFRSLRERREVAQKCGGFKTLCHPLIGDITLVHQSLSVNGNPDLELSMYTAHDETSKTALQFLSAWDTTRAAAESRPTPAV